MTLHTAPFLRTASGRDLLLSRPDAICIEDIAAHLAKINRFNGATSDPYSVAQHSALVQRLAALSGGDAATQLWALLHDAHEAYLGDMPTPVQRHVFGDADKGRNILPTPWEEAQLRLDEAICAHCGLTLTAAMRDTVAALDRAALATEWRDLMPGPVPLGWPEAVAGIATILPHDNWQTAQEVWLSTFHRLHRAVAQDATR